VLMKYTWRLIDLIQVQDSTARRVAADEKATGGWRRWRSFRALASPRGRSWPSHGARATLQIVLIP
jgi:hypothetical protein